VNDNHTQLQLQVRIIVTTILRIIKNSSQWYKYTVAFNKYMYDFANGL